jgi:hypothetical protein
MLEREYDQVAPSPGAAGSGSVRGQGRRTGGRPDAGNQPVFGSGVSMEGGSRGLWAAAAAAIVLTNTVGDTQVRAGETNVRDAGGDGPQLLRGPVAGSNVDKSTVCALGGVETLARVRGVNSHIGGREGHSW